MEDTNSKIEEQSCNLTDKKVTLYFVFSLAYTYCFESPSRYHILLFKGYIYIYILYVVVCFESKSWILCLSFDLFLWEIFGSSKYFELNGWKMVEGSGWSDFDATSFEVLCLIIIVFFFFTRLILVFILHFRHIFYLLLILYKKLCYFLHLD